MPMSKVLSPRGAISLGVLTTTCVPHCILHDPSFFPCSLTLSHSLPEEELPFPAGLAAFRY